MIDLPVIKSLLPPLAAAFLSLGGVIIGYLRYKKRKDAEIAQAASQGVIEGTKVVQESHRELIEFFRQEVSVLRNENLDLREKVRAINQHLDSTLLKLNSIKNRLVITSQVSETNDREQILIHGSVIEEQIRIIDEIIAVLQETRPVA